MAPLLADVSQGQALRLYQVECLARRSRAAVERVHAPQRFPIQLTPRTEAVPASPLVDIQIVKTAGAPRAAQAQPHPLKDIHPES